MSPSDPTQLLAAIDRATHLAEAVLKATDAALAEQAAVTAGAMAAQTAVVSLLMESGAVRPEHAEAHFRAALKQFPGDPEGRPEARALQSLIRFLRDAYRPETPPDDPRGPRLTVIPGGLAQGGNPPGAPTDGAA